jgi:hypothetical protein
MLENKYTSEMLSKLQEEYSIDNAVRIQSLKLEYVDVIKLLDDQYNNAKKQIKQELLSRKIIKYKEDSDEKLDKNFIDVSEFLDTKRVSSETNKRKLDFVNTEIDINKKRNNLLLSIYIIVYIYTIYAHIHHKAYKTGSLNIYLLLFLVLPIFTIPIYNLLRFIFGLIHYESYHFPIYNI